MTGISEITYPYRPLVSYTYDLQDQLTKETYYFYENGSLMYTDTEEITYTYDTAGNILSSNGGGNTVSYAYTDTNWPDLLTGITVNGTYKAISYNSGSGNPTTWYNGTDYSDFRWEQGNRLAQVCSNGSYKYYRYDMSGVRTEKTVGGVTHSYVTQNGKVVRESYGSKVLDFIYDAAGRPFALRYSSNGGSSFTTYYYRLNLQGDVIALVNTDGSTEAIYEYDAWGYPLYTSATTMSSINPLRYRGYYYDTETGWYYLQSRYYDPAVRRFINADSYAGTGQSFLGYNMFAYCENSPIAKADPNGQRPFVNCMCADSGTNPFKPEPEEVVLNSYKEGTSRESFSQSGRDEIPGALGMTMEYDYRLTTVTRYPAGAAVSHSPKFFVPKSISWYVSEYDGRSVYVCGVPYNTDEKVTVYCGFESGTIVRIELSCFIEKQSNDVIAVEQEIEGILFSEPTIGDVGFVGGSPLGGGYNCWHRIDR